MKIKIIGSIRSSIVVWAHRTGKIIFCTLGLFLLCSCALSRKVAVQSTPSGATVLVDGVEKGITPLAPVKLQWSKDLAGHELTIKADKYEAQQVVLSFDQAKASGNPWVQEITLAPLERVLRVQFVVTPGEALVSINGAKPVQAGEATSVTFTRESSAKPWSVPKARVSLPKFDQSVPLVYDQVAKNPVMTVNLGAVVAEGEAHFDVTPAGAAVTIEGGDSQSAAKPLAVVFTRKAASEPWSTIRVNISAPKYESQAVELTYDDIIAKRTVSASLQELQRDVPVDITANVEGTVVTVNGDAAGTTPVRHTFTFNRAKGGAEWNTFLVVGTKEGYRYVDPGAKAEPGQARPFSRTLTMEEAMKGTLDMKLDLVRYVVTPVRRVEPSSEGMKIVTEKVLSQIGEIEREPKVGGATRISDAPPDRAMVEARISVMPDSKQVVFSSPFKLNDSDEEEFFSIWISRGSEQVRLTDAPQVDFEPSCTADGKWIYFSSNRLNHDQYNIWRMQAIGRGGLTKITDSPSSIIDTEPVLSPNGEKLAYVSYNKGAKLPHIWVANPDGTLPTEIRVGRHPAWSPDGQRITYVAPDTHGKDKVWVMDADGGSPTQLTSGDQTDLFPVWTPDGKRIVYASDQAVNEEGQHNFDIWIMKADSTAKTQLTVNGSKDTRPAVSPNGKYIYFLSNRGARKPDEPSMQIWRIDLPAEEIAATVAGK